MQTTIDDQAQVVESLRSFTEEHTKKMPDFVGTSVHVSIDGKTVVNYVQWKTRSAFDAMLQAPAAQEHMRELRAFVVSVSPMFYDVVYVGQATS